MKILADPAEVIRWRRSGDVRGDVGLVPTMGGLHAGHRSLIRRCRDENRHCVVSLFVNPTQFNDPKDLESYPVTFEADAAMCREEGVDVLFTPTAERLYPDGYRYRVAETEMSRLLCGANRPGHFDNNFTVLTFCRRF